MARPSSSRTLTALLVVLAACAVSVLAADPPPSVAYETVAIRGKIVWLSEALARRYEIAVDPDAAKYDIALESADGTLTPIVKDFRGRGFHLDPKLHAIDWELLVRRFPGSPFVQVVRSYAWRDGKKYEFDYWCDICAIPMYELKECECCQGPIRFRFRETKE